MGLGVALALRVRLPVQASWSYVGSRALATWWVGWKSKVPEDMAVGVGFADVREEGAGSSAGTGEDVVEVRSRHDRPDE